MLRYGKKYDKYRLPTFEELMTEEYSFDLAFADYIKRMQELYGVGNGAKFEEMFKRVHHADDPEVFDKLLAELKKKGLMQ